MWKTTWRHNVDNIRQKDIKFSLFLSFVSPLMTNECDEAFFWPIIPQVLVICVVIHRRECDTVKKGQTQVKGPQGLLIRLYSTERLKRLTWRYTGRVRKRDKLLTGGGGRGAKSSYDNEKAWSSINYSILFVYIYGDDHWLIWGFLLTNRIQPYTVLHGPIIFKDTKP